jgi:cytochrome P450
MAKRKKRRKPRFTKGDRKRRAIVRKAFGPKHDEELHAIIEEMGKCLIEKSWLQLELEKHGVSNG